MLARLLSGCADATIIDDDPVTTPPRPEVGQCYMVDADGDASFAVSANDLEPVACTEPHDAETYAVPDAIELPVEPAPESLR